MQPQFAQHHPADCLPDTPAFGNREPDGRGDPPHRGARPDVPVSAVVGRSEHRWARHICSVHSVLQVNTQTGETLSSGSGV